MKAQGFGIVHLEVFREARAAILYDDVEVGGIFFDRNRDVPFFGLGVGGGAIFKGIGDQFVDDQAQGDGLFDRHLNRGNVSVDPNVGG